MNHMNILVTGAKGQLGQELKSLSALHPKATFYFTDVEDLDILQLEQVQNFVVEHRIDALINCAAYTAVDKAESEQELCMQINAIGPENLAKAAAQVKARFIHISTDFVFNGNSYVPYTEMDAEDPLGVYGSTKLRGEKRVVQAYPQSVILRTSWLYSSFGNNFVKTMLRLGKEREQLGVIFDQVGTPTYAHDLAQAIMVILGSDDERYTPGIYHYSNEGVASWYDFTKAIHEIGGVDCKVQPILAEAYPLPAARPHYSVLNKAKIKSIFSIEIPYWRESLKKCMALLNEEIENKNNR